MSTPPETERAQICEEALADLFADDPSDPQVLLSVGAQPGAGKTRAIEAVRAAFYPDHDLAAVVGDDLRKYHPDYARLVRDPDPLAMPAATADLSGWLVGQALDWAAEHGHSVLVEGTLRRPGTTLSTLERFHSAGAITHLVVLGVPEAVSWIGCLDRYLTSLARDGAARWTPQEAHDAGYTGTPATLAAAGATAAVHRLSVVARDGAVAYDGTRDVADRTRSQEALRALEELRSDPEQIRRAEARLEQLVAIASDLGVGPAVREGLDHARTLVQPPASSTPGPAV